MKRFPTKVLTLVEKSHPNIIKRNYDTGIRLNKILPPLEKTALQKAGLCPNHPMIVDPQKPNLNGSLTIKGQVTHGKGSKTNPSKIYIIRISQDKKIPKCCRSLWPDSSNIYGSISHVIVGSEKVLDDKGLKDNGYVVGIKPSDFINGKKYYPPGGKTKIQWQQPIAKKYPGKNSEKK